MIWWRSKAGQKFHAPSEDPDVAFCTPPHKLTKRRVRAVRSRGELADPDPLQQCAKCRRMLRGDDPAAMFPRGKPTPATTRARTSKVSTMSPRLRALLDRTKAARARHEAWLADAEA